MGKSLTFVSNTNGSSCSKTKKRMRGDATSRPEIKIYDPTSTLSSDFQSKDCCCCYMRNLPTDDRNNNTLYNHTPYRLGYPTVGTASTQIVGRSFFLKYIRLKGFIWTTNYLPVGVRWRIILLKYNGTVSISLTTHDYINLFLSDTISDPDGWGTPGTVDNFDKTEDGSLKNFYMKIKDVAKWNGNFKRKVIASGFVPPNYVPEEFHGLATQAGQTTNTVRYDLYNAADGDASVEYRHCQPFDVKVTLNDRINVLKYTSQYWLIFESDVACGFKVDVVHDSRIVSDATYAAGSPINVHFAARGYYTDD